MNILEKTSVQKLIASMRWGNCIGLISTLMIFNGLHNRSTLRTHAFKIIFLFFLPFLCDFGLHAYAAIIDPVSERLKNKGNVTFLKYIYLPCILILLVQIFFTVRGYIRLFTLIPAK